MHALGPTPDAAGSNGLEEEEGKGGRERAGVFEEAGERENGGEGKRGDGVEGGGGRSRRPE